MATEKQLQEIVNKVYAGDELTREEDILYMTEILEFSLEDAKRILSINANKDSSLIID